MAVELSHLMQLVLGQRQYLTIGNLPQVVREHFGCDPGIVYLRQKEAIHIFEGHREMDGQDFMQLTFVVEKGHYFRDPKRPMCMTVIHREDCIRDRPYMLGLKTVGTGEVWISTFHLTNETKMKQRVGKWPIIAAGLRK